MKNFLFLILILSLTAAAQNKSKELIQEFGSVKIYKVIEDQKEFATSTLNLDKIVVKPDKTEVLANFGYTNFKLGTQSSTEPTTVCANSDKGQHIHFIQDNEPYTAMYESFNKFKAAPGHHVVLAFLSRSYHQSLKHKAAFILTEYNVGEAKDDFNEKKPHLFYSRPKGTYVDKDAENVMIDFYLTNCELSDKGFKVKVEIDDNISFIATNWTPLIASGLSIGEHKIKLTLLDKKDKPVVSKFNGMVKKFILSKTP